MGSLEKPESTWGLQKGAVNSKPFLTVALLFLMWTTFKVLIEFVIIWLLFCFGLLALRPENRTGALCVGRRSLNHWTTREASTVAFFRLKKS